MEKKPPVGKTIGFAYAAVTLFAAAFVIGGILLGRKAR